MDNHKDLKDCEDFRKFCNNIGKRIVALRKKHGFSQEKLALEVDVDTSFIGRIERADRSASLKTIFLIAKAFDMNLSDFLKFKK